MADIDSELRTLLTRWLDPDDDWKDIILELSVIERPFTTNTGRGLSYMACVVCATMCRKCSDRKAFKWMDAFAKAWLNGEELPIFQEGCWIEECDGIV